MKLSGFTYLLGRSLAMLGSIAGKANGAEAASILNRVHARWHASGVTLTATDAHRALLITLAPERPGISLPPEESEAVFNLSPDPWSEGQLFHTIFRAPDGDVKLIGERMEPVGISRTRTEPAAFGINLGHVKSPSGVSDGSAYPIGSINSLRADFGQGKKHGVRLMEVNPVYMAGGLAMVSGLWQCVQHPAHPERVDMQLPDHQHAPMRFTSKCPEKQPLFEIEYILMPYRSP